MTDVTIVGLGIKSGSIECGSLLRKLRLDTNCCAVDYERVLLPG